MTRESKSDLLTLEAFLKTYNLGHLLKERQFNSLLAKIHSKYLSLLIFSAELSEQKNNETKPTSTPHQFPTPTQHAYLEESLSDIGQSLFCWMHGAYKASRVMLRSSIETFTKGFCCAEIPGILTEKRVHEIFHQCLHARNVTSHPNRKAFSELHSKYGELCADVHTATANNMASISSINHFPTFNATAAASAADAIVFVASRILILLCIEYNSVFHNMHHRNRESVVDCLISSYKKKIQNIE